MYEIEENGHKSDKSQGTIIKKTQSCKTAEHNETIRTAKLVVFIQLLRTKNYFPKFTEMLQFRKRSNALANNNLPRNCVFILLPYSTTISQENSPFYFQNTLRACRSSLSGGQFPRSLKGNSNGI